MIISCDFCKKDFNMKPSAFKKSKNHFCSINCRINWQKENYPRGKNHPNWKEKAVVNCDFCGKEIEKYQAWAKRTKNNFCCKKCHVKWQSSNLLGKNSPRWNRKLINCDSCGKEFLVPNYKKNNKHHFCSNECYFKWLKKNGRPYMKNNFKGGRIKVECTYCGIIMEMAVSRKKNRKNIFCNKKCYDDWQRKMASTGNKNMLWDRFVIKCETCNEDMYLNRYRLNKNKHHFCSRECMGHWRKYNWCNENNPRWNSKRIKCNNCGKNVYVKKSKREKQLFCNGNCFFEWLRKNPRLGKENPNWRAIESTCDYCHKPIFITPYRKNNSEFHFCNKECFDKWSKINKPRGKESPIWKGGKMPYYGSCWAIQKNKILKRAECRSELSGTNGVLLDIHHIVPMRIFIQKYMSLCLGLIPDITPASFRILPYDLFIPDVIFDEANRVENLICVTRREHAKFEGMPITFFKEILKINKDYHQNR